MLRCVALFRAVSILPNRIIGTVGEHAAGFPVEALSLSRCGQWLASCSHDQLVKFSDVREVPTHRVNGHRRLRRTDQKKVLSSKVAAERDFFGDLDPEKGESSKQAAAAESSCSEDDSTGSESDGAQDACTSAKVPPRKSRGTVASSVTEDAEISGEVDDIGSHEEDDGSQDADSSDDEDEDDDDDD